MDISFENKVVLITGGASGIGFDTAKLFAQSKANVVIADIDVDALKSAASQLQQLGYKVKCFKVDVASEASVKLLIEKIVEVYGKLDIAYNNVGVHAKSDAKLADTDTNDFNRVLSINLGGVYNCMKYEIKQMETQQSKGVIVNCSSQSGVVGLAGVSAYTASKHAVLGLTKCAALEYARIGIRINAICPGTTDTPMVANAIKMAPEHMAKVIDDIPLGRMGTGNEIASLVLWLCSDYAGFAIGQTFIVDGGYTII